MNRLAKQRMGWLVAALALQAVLALWAVNAVGLIDQSTDPVVVPTELSPSSTPIDIESGQTIALNLARSWSSSARLVSVVMRLEWPQAGGNADEIALPDGGWLVFTFANGDATLSLYLDRRTGVYITSATSEFGDSILPTIDLSGYSRGSSTAALAAEVLQGAAYRALCPATRTTALVTPSREKDTDGESVPVWTVTYADSRYASDFDVLVQLDARTGNVLKNEAAERPCESE